MIARKTLLFVVPFFHHNMVPALEALAGNKWRIILCIGGGADWPINYDYLFSFCSDVIKLSNVHGSRRLRTWYPGIARVNRIYSKYKPSHVLLRETSVLTLTFGFLAKLNQSRVAYFDQSSPHINPKLRRLMRLLITSKVATNAGPMAEGPPSIETVCNLPFIAPIRISTSEIERKYIDIDNRPVHILTIGKLANREKNLLALLKGLETSGRQQDIILTIIGRKSGPDQQYYESLQEELARLQRGGARINLIEDAAQSEVQELIVRADVFFLPSYNETASFSQFEAMGAGLPIFLCGDNGTAYAVVNNENGFVFDPSAENICNVIEWIVSNKCQLLRMALSSYIFAKEKFSETMFVNRLEKLFCSD